MKIVVYCTVVLFCCIAAGLAFAADRAARPSVTELDIEELMKIEVQRVYGASKFEQDVTQAPSSVTIITAAQIKQYGYRTLADALGSVNGFYITYDRTYSNAGSRGFSQPADVNSRFLVLLDGHKMNDSMYDWAYIGDESLLDIDLVDRIEVVRGPGSSLYGNNAFFGVINIITRRPDMINGAEISGAASSFDGYKERMTYGKRYDNGLGILVSGSHMNSKGQSFYFKEYDTAATNFGRSDGCDHGKYSNFFSTLSYKDFTLQGGYISREKVYPASPFNGLFNTDKNRVTDERGYVDLGYRKNIGEKSTLSVRLFYDYLSFEGTVAASTFVPPMLRGPDKQ